MTAPTPPRVAPALTLGITGHRAEAFAEGGTEAITARLAAVFVEARSAATRLFTDEARFFSGDTPRFTLVSPLADGADQLGAEQALAQGYALSAALPFTRADYAGDFEADGAARFAALLDRAGCALELPGDRADAHAAYVMAGKATVAHCDILIAVWDGLPARGRGGTAEIIDFALLRGMPVIHVPVGPAAEVRILWGGFDPQVSPVTSAEVAARTFGRENLGTLLAAMLAPPVDPRERGFLLSFYAERERRIRKRFEYPLLLTVTGVKRMHRGNLRTKPYAEVTQGEWAPFHARCGAPQGVSMAMERLQEGYCWADGLAQHFAQSYRSGHVFNFLLGAAAIVLALTSLLWPDVKVALAVGEFVLILAIIANTRMGSVSAWHRRWLDYRQLAEQLRPMRSLKLLALARPQGCGKGPRRWTDWYAAAMWRGLGAPSGRIPPAGLDEFSTALLEEEVAPQIAYHRGAAATGHKLEHRLHRIGTALFAATVVGCIVLIAGFALFPYWTKEHGNIFVFLSAGLPALGTAIFGIRVQGDFGGTATRSEATAAKLDAIATEIVKAADLPRAASLFESASAAMVADLEDWRLEHQKHELVIP